MPHTDKVTVLANYIENLLISKKDDLGIQEVYYGEQYNIPVALAVTVQSWRKGRKLDSAMGPGGQTLNELRVIVSVYNSTTGTEAEQRLIVEQLSENIEVELHKDTSMGGNIIHGFVEDWESGVAIKQQTMFRVVQMVFVGTTKTSVTQ